MNKKGMMDDMFDFLFTVVAAFFILFFVNSALNGGVAKAETRSLGEVADLNLIDSAIDNLRVQMEEGAGINPEEIERLVAQSRVLDGRTITNCLDYTDEINCGRDTVGLYLSDPNRQCGWENGKCVYKTFAAGGTMAK